MTDIASIVPDTKVPVAPDLLKASGAQQVTPIEDSVSSQRDANGAAAKTTQPAEQPTGNIANDGNHTQAGPATAAEKPGGLLPSLKKGPRGGIHWGAGQPTAHCHTVLTSTRRSCEVAASAACHCGSCFLVQIGCGLWLTRPKQTLRIH